MRRRNQVHHSFLGFSLGLALTVSACTTHYTEPVTLTTHYTKPGTFITSPAGRNQQCEQLLPGMRTIMQALRQNQSLTPDQQATWRTWNADCYTANWQQQLAEKAPPPPPEQPAAPEAPSTEVLPTPAPPPVEDKVEVKFDRFKNHTTVTFPSPQQVATRADTQLTPVWLAIFNGQTPSTMPSTVLLAFWKISNTWQYLRCHSLAMLADGSPIQLPPAEHDGKVGQGYVRESILVTVSLATARLLAESRLVEFKICNTEGRFSARDLQGLRSFINALTPQ